MGLPRAEEARRDADALSYTRTVRTIGAYVRTYTVRLGYRDTDLGRREELEFLPSVLRQQRASQMCASARCRRPGTRGGGEGGRRGRAAREGGEGGGDEGIGGEGIG